MTNAFVNDWSILSKAVEALKPFSGQHYVDVCSGYGDEVEDNFIEALPQIVEWVPKLIESWAELFELSMDLTALVAAERLNKTPAGIFLPDTVVRPSEGL